jgi:hypothetical protein
VDAPRGVFAYGYYLLACEPQRYCGFIWIALAGKIHLIDKSSG